ncbi:MAG: hypothetical protein R3E86_21665 [Pseudomonadales bacterium]
MDRNRQRKRGAMAALAGVLTLAAAAAAAAEAPVRVPDCGVMESIAARLDAGERVPINRWVRVDPRSTGLTLAAAVAAPAFADAFGKPMLDWTRADLAAFSPAVGKCINAATRARRFEEQKQLIELRRVVQFHMNQPLGTVERARQAVAENLAALEALPVTRDALRIVSLISRMQDARADEGAVEIRRSIEQIRDSQGSRPGRLVAASVQSLPQAEADAAFRRVDTLRDRLMESVLADIEASLAGLPDSVQGLATLNGLMTSAASDLADIVPRTAMDALDAAARRSRARIWKAIEQTVAAMPETAEGAAQLQALTSGAAYGDLAAADRARLAELAGHRREQVARAALQGPIEQLERYPVSIDGLRELAAFAAKTRRELAGTLDATSRQAFENAYAEARRSRSEAVQDDFEDWLEHVPDSREGVAQINALLAAVDAPAGSSLYQAGMARSREIATAVGRAERNAQCRAALPDVDLDDDEAALPVLGFGGSILRLGDVLCNIALSGNRVHGYESPGLFGDDHELQVSTRDGVFLTYTLHEVPVGPDDAALMGVKVAEPTRERTLDVDGWRTELARLLPRSPAGRDARCRQLMNTPEGALSAQDRMDALECLMGSLLGQ